MASTAACSKLPTSTAWVFARRTCGLATPTAPAAREESSITLSSRGHTRCVRGRLQPLLEDRGVVHRHAPRRDRDADVQEVDALPELRDHSEARGSSGHRGRPERRCDVDARIDDARDAAPRRLADVGGCAQKAPCVAEESRVIAAPRRDHEEQRGQAGDLRQPGQAHRGYPREAWPRRRPPPGARRRGRRGLRQTRRLRPRLHDVQLEPPLEGAGAGKGAPPCC